MQSIKLKTAFKALMVSLLAYAEVSGASDLPPKMKAIIPMGGGGIFARALNPWSNEIYEASFSDKKLYIINGATDRVKDHPITHKSSRCRRPHEPFATPRHKP